MGNGESGVGNGEWDRGRDWDRESGAVGGQPKADSLDWRLGTRDWGLGSREWGMGTQE